MGILRLLLAIAVLIDHSGPLFGFKLVTGVMAVESFFIVSGFYMALVLNEKYIGAKGSYSLFLSNRLLRLFPIYWVMLLLTILVSSVCLYWFGEPLAMSSYVEYHHLMPHTWALLLFSNLFIIGQDIVMFLGLNTADGSVYFTRNFLETQPGLYTYLFVHQAWSLSLEIIFYIMAPFLCRRNTLLLIFVAAFSFAIRVYVHRLGLTNDPWTYRFFPSELMFFVAGILCYKVYNKFKALTFSKFILSISLYIVILFSTIYQFLPDRIVVQMVYYVVFAGCLPFIFILTKKNKTDYRIGELSYPIYIAHLLVLFLLQALQKYYPFSQSILSILLIVITTALSLGLIRFIAEPIERVRQRRVTGKAKVLPQGVV